MDTLKEKWAKVKPTLMAIGFGLIVGPFISNALGWQVTSGALDKKLEAALLDLQVNFCVEKVKAAGVNTKGIDFGARRDIAKKWAVMPGQDSADYEVMRGCSDRIVS